MLPLLSPALTVAMLGAIESLLSAVVADRMSGDRHDPNVELIRYAEAWERKIQINTPADTVRDVAKRLHNNPMVTVAIRSDGSVESVTFFLSSGMPDVDEAIRRIVQSQAPYQVFPPGLVSEQGAVVDVASAPSG